MDEDAPFPVESVNRTTDKVFRGSALQPFVSGGRFHLRVDEHGNLIPALATLFDEMVVFPSGEHDDTVDAAMDMMQLAMQGGGSMPVNRITVDDGGVESMYR